MTFRMTYVICQWNLTRNLTLMSSTGHLHVICRSSVHRPHETSIPIIFPVKYQSNSSAKISEIFNRLVFPLNFNRFCHPMTLNLSSVCRTCKCSWSTDYHKTLQWITVLLVKQYCKCSVKLSEETTLVALCRIFQGISISEAKGPSTSWWFEFVYKCGQNAQSQFGQ